MKPILLPSVCLLSMLCVASADDASADAEGIQFFERKIRPVLVKHCYECHSADADEAEGGLFVDSRQGLAKGGETGPAVVPKNLEDSLLIASLEYDGIEMPPDGQLPEGVIADFRRWIQMGAPDPRNADMPADATDPAEDESSLWSLAPITEYQIPSVQDTAWPHSELDYFIRARQEAAGITPVGDADSQQLLRRVFFDLVGLPPTPEDVTAFAADHSPAAYAALVDRLLDSPHFGERWARHWMDAVRYGESAGSSRDVLMPYAWRYRDYVIDSYNADVPFDRVVTEQVAGDLLPAESPDERDRLLIATGLLAIGSKSLNGGNLELDIADDQIDVIGKAVLGLTISCARCHDHKFDPIPTADYYALAGIFRSTETFYGGGTNRPKNTADELKVYLPLGPDANANATAVRQHEKQLADLKKQKDNTTKRVQRLKKALPENWEERYAQRESKPEEKADDPDAPQDNGADDNPSPDEDKDAAFLMQVEEYRAAQQALSEIDGRLKELGARDLPQLEWAVGVRDKNQAADSPIQVRGEKNNSGDVVPRGFLSCVASVDELESPVDGSALAAIDAKQSGRLHLAAWLTDPANPLTARVAVNRIWQHLFGRGLVATADNFGTNGELPTHPELLDDLAHRYIHVHHWSTKSLIREIVGSRSYQMAAAPNAAAAEADPLNTLYWRMPRRRLEAECLRDAMLAASGELDLSRPHGSAVLEIGEGEVGRGINTKPLSALFVHRSVYLPIIRGAVPEVLKLFDFPEPSNPQGVRDETNVPAQSLYLMNSPFVIAQSENLATLVTADSDDDLERLNTVYLRCYARQPREDEIAEALAFLSEFRGQMNESGESGQDAEQEHVAWSALAQALMAGAEFRYIQ